MFMLTITMQLLKCANISCLKDIESSDFSANFAFIFVKNYYIRDEHLGKAKLNVSHA